MKTDGVLEVAIFKVKPTHLARMTELRAGLREALKSFPGLVDYRGYCPIDDVTFADLARWVDLKSAKAVASAFEQGDPRFLPYIEAIESVSFMGHFVPEEA